MISPSGKQALNASITENLPVRIRKIILVNGSQDLPRLITAGQAWLGDQQKRLKSVVCAQSGGLQILGASPPVDIVGLVGDARGAIRATHVREGEPAVCPPRRHRRLSRRDGPSGGQQWTLPVIARRLSPHLVSCPTWDRDTNDALDR
jgi:hypothetical protein